MPRPPSYISRKEFTLYQKEVKRKMNSLHNIINRIIKKITSKKSPK